MESWPERIRQAMVAPQNEANRQAQTLEHAGQGSQAATLRLFGRLNGIEDALIALSEQIEEQANASRR